MKTQFTTKNGTEIPVDYRMQRKGDRWLVYDVSVEGLSLVGNYRGQFNKIIETSSYQDLVKKMKARNEEFGRPPPQEEIVAARQKRGDRDRIGIAGHLCRLPLWMRSPEEPSARVLDRSSFTVTVVLASEARHPTGRSALDLGRHARPWYVTPWRGSPDGRDLLTHRALDRRRTFP